MFQMFIWFSNAVSNQDFQLGATISKALMITMNDELNEPLLLELPSLCPDRDMETDRSFLFSTELQCAKERGCSAW
jgi:hypothetical protein